VSWPGLENSVYFVCENSFFKLLTAYCCAAADDIGDDDDDFVFVYGQRLCLVTFGTVSTSLYS